jgi:FixJ family two-component response regulator
MTAPLIFVVDDDPALRHSTCLLLRVLGWRAQSFAGGEEYLTALRDTVPDCVLMDLHLDGMNCPEILDASRAMGVHVPVIAITGLAPDSADADIARAAGVVAVLSKPFGEAALRAAVEPCLRPG